MSRREWLRAVAAIALLGGSRWALGSNTDAYPRLARVLRLYATSPAGGAVDLIARTLANEAEQRTSINFAILNIDGANGEIALNKFGAEPADGRSWLITHDSPIVINPSFYPRRSTDILDRLQPVAGVATSSFYLLVRVDDPIRSLDDLIREAGKLGVEINYGTGGVGTYHHLVTEDLAARAKLNLVHVPYRGNSLAVYGLVRGDVRMVTAGVSALPLVRSGRLRMIATTSPKRNPTFPDVPALAEFFAGFQGTAWFALFGSAGVAPSTITDMSVLVREIVQSKAYAERIYEAGNIDTEYFDAETLTARIHADRKRFAELIAKLPADAMQPQAAPN